MAENVQTPIQPSIETEVYSAQPELAFGGKQFSVRRFTLPAGIVRTERYAVPPDFFIIASADGVDTPFDFCFGDAFLIGNALTLGLNGRAVVPAVAPALTFRGGAADADVIVIAQRGYPQTDYHR